jgi:hypothetical protein
VTARCRAWISTRAPPAELGIDAVQIDSGWQLPPDSRGDFHPPQDNGWRPHPTIYPDGWTNIRRRAAQKGVQLGLWGAAQRISREELVANYREGGFVQWNLDFANLRDYEDVRELCGQDARVPGGR